MRLRLPVVLAAAVLGTVAAVACGSHPEEYFCYDNGMRPDAGPMAPDAAPCGEVVTDPADCPEGCEAEPIG